MMSQTDFAPKAHQADAPMQSLSAIDRLAQLCLKLAAAALLLIACVQGYQVLARYLLNQSSTWTDPLSSLLLATVMSFSAAYGVHHQQHFRFTLLIDRAGKSLASRLHAVGHLLMAVVGLSIAVKSGVLLADGWFIVQAGIALPQSAAFLPVMLGFACMAVFASRHFYRCLRPHKPAVIS